MSDLGRAVDTVVHACLGIEPGENVMVLTDPPKRAVADLLVSGARAAGAEAVLVEMSERETHGSEPPAPVAATLLECDVLIAPTTKSVTHTRARRAASERGMRAATMGGVTEEMLARTMTADYDKVAQRSRAIADALSAGREVTLRSAGGTDITFSIEGRDGIADDGDLTAPGTYGNLPAGEGFIAPVEGSANGTIVFDGSIWPIGVLAEPIVVTVSEGYAAALEGPRAAEFKRVIEPYGRDAFAVAELGIGTNDRATLTGNVLEDEKILGTAHVAFGGNFAFGGTIEVASHQDGVILDATVAIDGRTILERGRLHV